jgi:GntR family transcriptional regulator
VLRFRNVLSLEGVKLMLDDITLPERLFPKLTEKRLRERPSTLYNLYQDDFGISVVRTEQRLRAALAPREIARALDITAGLPMLEIHRIAYAYHDTPVEFRVSHVDTRKHDYVGDTRR